MNHSDARTLVDLVMMGIQKSKDDGYMDEGYEKQVDKAVKRCFKVLNNHLEKEDK